MRTSLRWPVVMVAACVALVGMRARALESLLDYASSLDGDDGVLVNYTIATPYASIPVEFVRYSGNRTYSANTSLGSATPDARMLMVRIEGNMTINSGVSVTAAARKRGMVIYVMGDLRVNGTLTMTARGAANVAGDQLLVVVDAKTGTSYTIPAAGAAGAAASCKSGAYPGVVSGGTGSAGSSGGSRSGGGGSGGDYVVGSGCSGAGAAGTSYSGGSGGGGFTQGSASGGSGTVNGGPGGNGSSASYPACGGAGNNGGSGSGTGAGAGGSGTGGTLIVLVGGNIVISSTGLISSDGSAGGSNSGNPYAATGGGGSGGGIIDLFYGNAYTNSGTVRTSGGAAGAVAAYGYGVIGGAGGAGSARSAAFPPFRIQGRVTNELTGAGVDGVSISYSGGASPLITSEGGYYSFWVSGHWAGSVTCSPTFGTIAEPTRVYADVTSSQAEQDFSWSPPAFVAIVGRVVDATTSTALDGAVVRFSGGAGDVVTAGGGYFSNDVPYLWSGTISIASPAGTFTPTERTYAAVDMPLTGQSFDLLPPYSIDQRTVLLLHGDGAPGSAAITDSSMYHHSMSALGQANNSAGASVFGGTSLSFDGTGDEVRTADAPEWNLGTNNFTIEAWVRGSRANAPVATERMLGQWDIDGAGFTLSQNWSTFNVATLNSGLLGYRGGVFDGRYIYFPPYFDGSVYHGRVVRFDTRAAFTSSANWTNFDAGGIGGLVTKGYTAGAFDGRYVYFAPYYDGTAQHGRVLRFDTRGNFGSANSWSSYDAGSTEGLSTKGYIGMVVVGRYVYFVPYADASGQHARVLRYDTQGDFDTAGSWAAYDASSTGGLATKGYNGAVTDGRYVYFVPYHDGTAQHGRVLRLDTQGNFHSAGSWTAYDAGSTGGLSTKGYLGAGFDGRYVYFTPYADATSSHGRVLRYDTQGNFTTAGSWSAYDAGTTSGLTTKGYQGGGIFDGRYMYFVPHYDGSAHSGKVLRYDTQGGFTTAGSWTAFDAGNIGTYTKGFVGGTFDGRYVYFSAWYDGTGQSGKFLRYDTAPQGAFKLVWNEHNLSGSCGGGPRGVGFCINAGSIPYSLTSGEILDSNEWHHVAVTRKGSALRLFVDGAIKATNYIGSNAVIDSPASLTLGSYPNAAKGFAGYLDEVRIVNGLARWTAPFTNELPAAPYGSAVTVSGRLTNGVDSSGTDGVTINLGAFTATTANGGYYSRDVYYGWSGTIAPSFPGAVIAPVSRSLSELTADAADQNFGWQSAALEVASVSPTNTLGSGGSWVTLSGSNFRGIWYSGSWAYRKRIDIDRTQVAGTLTSYPMLVSRIDADLKSTGYGGHVGQTDGGDLLFTDATGTNKLAHEIEKYDPATGELVAWVNVPLVDTSRNTELYLYYGNAGAANQWNITGTWNSNYKGVWHLNDRSYSDTFNGTTLDSTLWGVWGTVTINNRLTMTATSASWNSSGISGNGKHFFVGDFDIQVDFDASSWTAPPTDAFEVVMNLLSPTEVYGYPLGFYLYPNGTKQVSTWQSESSGGWGAATVSFMSGKLRLTRSGSTLTAYYWNGSSWTQVGTFSGAHTAEIMHLNIYVNSRGTGRAVPATYIDNFIVNYGERAADSTANANNGFNVGAVRTGGIISTGRVFDGVNSYVQIPDSATMQNLQESSYSIQAWYKPAIVPSGGGTDNLAVQGVFMKQGYHEGLDVRPTYLEMVHWLTGDAYTGVGNTVPSAGQPYHMVGVVDRTAGSTRLYVNGTGASSTPWTPSTAAREYSTTPWRIGIGGPGLSSYRWPANGVIDEARLLATPLSAQWIATEYNNHGSPSTFCGFGAEEAATAWTNPNVRVFVDGVQAQALLLDSTRLSVLMPSHEPGPVDVTVIGPDGATSTLVGRLYVGPYIAGRTFDQQSGAPIAGATVAFSGGAGSALSDSSGCFTQYVLYGWSGTLTPSYGGGAFAPASRTASGLAAHLPNQDFAWISPPVITAVTPGTGTVNGGETVLITGSHFSLSPLPTVRFGSRNASSVARINDTTLSVVTPANPVGYVDVVVVDPSGLTGTLTGGYRYVPAAPTILSVDPSSGSTLGGYSVQINYSGGEVWGYRRPITLSPATSVTGLQVRVTFTTGTFDYGLAQTNGADLRFTQPDGTLLPYWIETWATNGTSTVWVQVRDTGVSTINVSYGNTNATSGSSGDATFEFFDDFLGTALNGSKWATGGGGATITVSGGLVTLDTGSDQGAAVLTRSQAVPYRTEARAYLYSDYDSINYMRFRWLDSAIAADSGVFDDGVRTAPQVFWQGTWTGTTIPLNTFIRLRSARQATSVQWQIFTDAGSQLYSNTYTPGASPTAMRYSVGDDATHGYGKLALDWAFTRKYVATEPTATVGSRQSGVLVDGVSAASVTILNSTSLVAVVPAHAAGVVSVSLLSPEGGSNTALNAFVYLPAISGRIVNSATGEGVDGVEVALSNAGGSTTTAGGGYYAITVDSGWSGDATVTLDPALGTGSFAPATRSYANVTAAQANQDYTFTPDAPVIAGRIVNLDTEEGEDGVTVTFSNGGGSTTTANGGYYSKTMTYAWSGTATPSYTTPYGSGTFAPATRTYSNVRLNQADQDYAWDPPYVPGNRYVSLTGLNQYPYTNWEMAARSIQAAVNAAAAGDSVLVADGTYGITGTVITIAKAITVKSVSGAAMTTVRRVSGNNGIFNMTVTNAVLDGFTVRDGFVHPGGYSGNAGGVYCSGGGIVRNCIIRNNAMGEAWKAGGLELRGSKAINCLIVANTAGGDPSRDSVGGVKLSGGSMLINCVVYGNSRGGGGGGAGGVYAGGGVPTSSGTNWVRNCIVIGNTSTWNDPIDLLADGGSAGALIVQNTDYGTKSGDVQLQSCIQAEPQFVNAGGSDFRLSEHSACIDRGNESFNPLSSDLAGDPRVSGAAIDLGAYEVQNPRPRVGGRITHADTGAGLAGIVVTLSNGGGVATTDGYGCYSRAVNSGWSGDLTLPAAASGSSYAPASRSLSNVTADQYGNDFVWTPPAPVVSGRITQHNTGVGVNGVTVTFSNGGGSTTTTGGGYYSLQVARHWSGSVTPEYGSGSFSPGSVSYTSLVTDQAGQNFEWIPPVYAIAGRVTHGYTAAGVDGLTIALSNGGGSTLTTNGGYYSALVYQNWSGRVTPDSSGGAVNSPAYRDYANVTSDAAAQDYVWTPASPVISGQVTNRYTHAGLSGVTVTFSNGGGSTTTDGSGNYSRTVAWDWSGTASPSYSLGTFSPASRSYTHVQTAMAGQNYEWISPARTITGVVTDQDTGNPVSGASISFGADGSATSGADGSYSKTLYYGWSGTATPGLSGGTFNPASRSYANLSADQSSENYVWRANKVIAGRVTNQTSGAGVDGVTLTFVGSGTAATTNGGYYSKTVTYGWSGDVTLSVAAGGAFTPNGRTYGSVTANQTSQDYGWTTPKTVSGRVTNQYTGAGVDGITVQFSNGGGTATTAGGGYYSRSLTPGWSGTLTPLGNGSYSPASRTINNLVADTLGQDFGWTPVDPVITGRVTNHYTGVGVDGVTVTLSAGGGSAVTAGGGYYTKTVSYGWSGTLTPQSPIGGTFNPSTRSLNNVTANQGNQNFEWMAPVYPIMGVVTNTQTAAGEADVTVTFTGVGSVTTAVSGAYSQQVYYGWSGSVTLSSESGGTYSPASRSYTSVASAQTGQNYLFTPYRQIAGRVTAVNTGAGVDGVTVSGTGVIAAGLTANGGYYVVTVADGWSGTLTPSSASGVFTPASRVYAAVTSDLAGQDFTYQPQRVIAGRVANQYSDASMLNVIVTLSNSGGSTLTTNGGYYSIKVAQGWSGTATPSYSSGTFNPANRSYGAVLNDQTGQDFAWIPQTQFTISGRVTESYGGSGADGVTITFSGGQGTATTAGGGYFTKSIPMGWSGTMTPSASGGSFSPVNRTVGTVSTDVGNQNFVWTPPPASGDRYVSPTGGNVYPYTNWTMAAQELQLAVNAATNGETVWVTNGTYNLASTVSIGKGIVVRSMNGAGATVLRRSGSGDYGVMVISHANAVVKGFTIENGKAAKAGVDLQSGYLVNSVVQDCTGAGVVLGNEVAARMANDLVVNNTGAGISGVGVVVNCTVADNGGAQVAASQVYNCVVKGTISSPLIAYSIASVPYGGAGNKSGDPLFVDAAYHLDADSPAVNTGNNGYNTLTTDLEGNPRILGQIDMGAYEQAPGNGIAVALGDEPDPIPAGDVLEYQVTALNSGPDVANGVVVNVAVPGTTTYLSNNVGSAYNAGAGTWTIGTLTVGNVAQLKFWVRTDAAGWITNVATIGSANVTAEPGFGVATNVTQVLGPVTITNVLATTSSQNSTVQWESVIGMGYSVYSFDGSFSGNMAWTQRAAMVASEEARHFIDADAGASQVMKRFYQVAFAGHSPTMSNVWGVIRCDLGAGFSMVAPPLRTDRKFDGQMGKMLAEQMTGNDDGIGGAGDEVYILQDGGSWRLLYLDGQKVWRESDGSQSFCELEAGEGFFVLRNGGASRLTFTGPVGNDATQSKMVGEGWSILGLSEGKSLDIKATFAAASPKGAAAEDNADLVVIQNPNGSWRRLMYVDGWGAPYDGNWFDLSSFQITTNKIEPGVAVYYFRQPAGSMRVGF